MYRNLAVIAGALTILSGALFVSDSAQAGASASAPSKNQHANQLVMQQGQTKQAGRNDFGITEYSSSARSRQR